MTVVLHALSIHRYIGLSTDTKPTIASPQGLAAPTVGSTFWEYDTELMYITYDGTNWVRKGNIIHGRTKTVRVTKAIAAAGDYAAEDVLSESASAGTAWTFAAIFGENGGGGYLTKAMALWQTTGLTPRITLYLFKAAPTSNLNDNVANAAPSNADKANAIGQIDLTALEDLGGVSMAVVTPSTYGKLPLWVDAAAAADDIIVIAVTRDAITGEVATNELSLELTLEQY